MASRPDQGASGEPPVLLLDEDEDLSSVIPEADRATARRALRARVLVIEPGPWDGGDEIPGCAGLLILEGMLTRDVAFAGQRSRELLGPGDILRPWEFELDHLPPYSESTWTVLRRTRLAVLDQALLRLGARWPALTDHLIRRTLHRSRWLAIRLAITGATRVDDRVLLLLWNSAGRWGRVTAEGTLVPLPLTHEDLADLVGARRPSVTTALTQLREQGRIEQRDDGWLLLGEPPASVAAD